MTSILLFPHISINVCLNVHTQNNASLNTTMEWREKKAIVGFLANAYISNMTGDSLKKQHQYWVFKWFVNTNLKNSSKTWNCETSGGQYF